MALGEWHTNVPADTMQFWVDAAKKEGIINETADLNSLVWQPESQAGRAARASGRAPTPTGRRAWTAANNFSFGYGAGIPLSEAAGSLEMICSLTDRLIQRHFIQTVGGIQMSNETHTKPHDSNVEEV
jgi:hypothetical protein